MTQSEKPYVAAFIRRLLPEATEEEIAEASENLRAYLNVLYDIFIEREAKQRAADSKIAETRDIITDEATNSSNL